MGINNFNKPVCKVFGGKFIKGVVSGSISASLEVVCARGSFHNLNPHSVASSVLFGIVLSHNSICFFVCYRLCEARRTHT